jgi:hypothetical protein
VRHLASKSCAESDFTIEPSLTIAIVWLFGIARVAPRKATAYVQPILISMFVVEWLIGMGNCQHLLKFHCLTVRYCAKN